MLNALLVPEHLTLCRSQSRIREVDNIISEAKTSFPDIEYELDLMSRTANAQAYLLVLLAAWSMATHCICCSSAQGHYSPLYLAITRRPQTLANRLTLCLCRDWRSVLAAVIRRTKRPRNGRLRALQRNSLLPLKNSLFFKIFSLLICVGNFVKSRCSTVVSCNEIGF